MRVAGWVGVEEGTTLLQEIVKLSLLVASAHFLSSESAGSSGSFEEDISDAVNGEFFSRTQFFLLLLHLLPE